MTNGKPPVVQLEVIQRLYGALVVGLAVFVAIVPFLSRHAFDLPGEVAGREIWLMTTSVFALAILVSIGGVGRVMIQRARTELRGRSAPESEDLLRLYFPYVVVRGALIEGLGFFGAVVYMVTGLGLGLLVAVAAIAGLVVTFPTRQHYERYRDRLSGGPI
ncbi:MAG: hypothetical protein R3244_07915 [Thermoanaerobaculia bacterium]|nr:hypothetical protein [Thermoanaerobaculia bacterium]